MENTGIMPVMDVNNGNNNGWNSWIWIIVLFFFFMWGGNGFGNRGNLGAEIFANGSMTRDQIADEFAYNDIKNGIRGVQNGLCDGFYAQNTTMLNGFNGIQRDICYRAGQLENGIMQTGYQLGNQIAENRFAAQQCCCDTNRNVDSVKYENAQNTCAITTNATANTQRILDKLCQMEANAKDQRIAELQMNLQTANYQLSQQAQNATLIGSLRPYPIPAYPATSPYQATTPYQYTGCGYANNVA